MAKTSVSDANTHPPVAAAPTGDTAAAADAGQESAVRLSNADLGETRTFTAQDARALEKYQHQRGITGKTAWVPAGE